MTYDYTQASAERTRSLEAAAAEIGKSMGQQPDEIRNDLVSEVRTLEKSARVKDFIIILAIRNIKERLLQTKSLSPPRQSSSQSQGPIRSEAHFRGDHLPESQFT